MMHFSHTREQQADALRAWIDKAYGFERRRAIIGSETGVSSEAWRELTELGLTALAVSEHLGGRGCEALDLFIVMVDLVRGLVLEPWLSTVMGTQFLKLSVRHEAVLAVVAAGRLRLACAAIMLLGDVSLLSKGFNLRARQVSRVHIDSSVHHQTLLDGGVQRMQVRLEHDCVHDANTHCRLLRTRSLMPITRSSMLGCEHSGRPVLEGGERTQAHIFPRPHEAANWRTP